MFSSSCPNALVLFSKEKVPIVCSKRFLVSSTLSKSVRSYSNVLTVFTSNGIVSPFFFKWIIGLSVHFLYPISKKTLGLCPEMSAMTSSDDKSLSIIVCVIESESLIWSTRTGSKPQLSQTGLIIYLNNLSALLLISLSVSPIGDTTKQVFIKSLPPQFCFIL